MLGKSTSRGFLRWAITLTALAPVAAFAGFFGDEGEGVEFHKIVVFGDSLSDPGNVFAATGQYSIRPFMPIPSAPYVIGGMHFTNGETWIERASRQLGTWTASGPALRVPGVYTNYAFGGARARPGSSSASPDLGAQVAMYLGESGGTVDPQALYVLWFGANDINDALAAGDPAAAASILQAAIGSIYSGIQTLWGAGARVFLIPNAPDLAKTPAVRSAGPAAVAGAEYLSGAFNSALGQLLSGLDALPQVRIVRLDVYSLLNGVIAAPETYGFANATEPCLKFYVVANVICSTPRTYLFWDAIHPTAAAHRVLAQGAVAALTTQ